MKLSDSQKRWGRRLVLVGAALVLLLLVNYSFREPRYQIVGWLRGETFFAGKPVSLWSVELHEYEALANSPARRSPSVLNTYLPFLFPNRLDTPNVLTATNGSLPMLIELLNDPDPRVRNAVCRRLIEFGPAARSAIPTLVEMLNHEDPSARRLAVSCLHHFDPKQCNAILLEKALTDPSSGTPEEVVHWLAGSADHSELARAALVEMTRHLDKDVRKSAIYHMVQVAPDRARPILLEWIRSTDKDRRWVSVHYVSRPISPNSPGAPVSPDTIPADKNLITLREALPILLGWLSERDDEWRKDTLKWLGEFGPEAKEAVPALLEILKNQNDPVYKAAWSAINEIDPDAARLLLPAGK